MRTNVSGSFQDANGKTLAQFNGWVEPKPHGGMTKWHGGGTLSSIIVNVAQHIFLQLDDGRRVPINPEVSHHGEVGGAGDTTVTFIVSSGSL